MEGPQYNSESHVLHVFWRSGDQGLCRWANLPIIIQLASETPILTFNFNSWSLTLQFLFYTCQDCSNMYSSTEQSFLKNISCVWVFGLQVCLCDTCMAGAPRGQKGGWDGLYPKLDNWVHSAECWTSGRVASTLICWATSLAPIFSNFIFYNFIDE